MRVESKVTKEENKFYAFTFVGFNRMKIEIVLPPHLVKDFEKSYSAAKLYRFEGDLMDTRLYVTKTPSSKHPKFY